jgi:hypothetical protein
VLKMIESSESFEMMTDMKIPYHEPPSSTLRQYLDYSMGQVGGFRLAS